MSIWLYLVLAIITFGFIQSRLLYHLHMFQLNSYRLKRYGLFVKTNYRKIIPISSMVFFLWIIGLSSMYEFFSESMGIVITVVWGLSVGLRTYVLQFKGERRKKPLVFTARVNRINGISSGLFLVMLFIASKSLNPLFVLVIIMLLAPWSMLLSNIALMPYEAFMKRYYYNDAKKMLQSHKELITVGITGSYGKTSVKFMLETILSQQFNTLVTPHSYNTTLGVIITVRKFLNRSHEVFVAEMGAKQKGDIKEICDLVSPSYGVITAVGPQHLETFGSLSTIIDTKFELAQAVGKKGTCFVNSDSNNVCEGTKRYNDLSYVTYGTNEEAIVRIMKVKQSIHGSAFTLKYKEDEFEYQTKLLGMHNILNIAGAVGVALELGMTYEKIYTGVKELKAVEHRLELKKQGDFFILDDAFNSNPTGAKSALDVLSQFDSGKKIIMTPGMIELGSMDYEIHYTFGQQISEVCDYVILIGENKTAAIKKGLVDSGYDMSKVAVMKNVFEGFNQIRSIASKGDVVLIENDLPDNFNE